MKTPKARAPETGTLVGVRLQTGELTTIDAWRREQPDLPSRPEAIRRLLALNKQDPALPAAGETAVEAQSAAPASKSEDLLRAAILAFADEITNDPDDDESAKSHEAIARQAANSPYISPQTLVNIVENEIHVINRMNKSKALEARARKKRGRALPA